MASGVTAVAYETVTDAQGGLPLLAPMSEVAGRMSIQAGAHRPAEAERRPRPAPRRRAGRAARQGGRARRRRRRHQAARMAVGLGAEVTILDSSLPRLRAARRSSSGPRPHPLLDAEAIEEECFAADVVIGAVLHPRRRGTEARHARDAVEHEAGLGAGRRRHRPGRLLRDLAPDDPCRSDLRRRRYRPLLRRQHAGRGAAHLEPRAQQCDAALRPALADHGLAALAAIRTCAPASTSIAARSPTRRSPRASASASTIPPA